MVIPLSWNSALQLTWLGLYKHTAALLFRCTASLASTLTQPCPARVATLRCCLLLRPAIETTRPLQQPLPLSCWLHSCPGVIRFLRERVHSKGPPSVAVSLVSVDFFVFSSFPFVVYGNRALSMVYLLWCTAGSRPDVSKQSVNLQGLGGGVVCARRFLRMCYCFTRMYFVFTCGSRTAGRCCPLPTKYILYTVGRCCSPSCLPHRHLSLRRRRTCTFLSSSTRGEWLWSYPDPDAEEGEEGKGKGGADGGNGGGADEAEEGSFSLALHDEVRFRVRTLEFTQVGGR